MKKKLLIIDDSKSIHRLVQAWLKEDPIEIHSAYDGKTGLVTAAALQPDLILLDIDMPQQSGFDICRTLKQTPVTARIPVVFLTAQSAAEEKIMGLDLGAEDYITKPF